MVCFKNSGKTYKEVPQLGYKSSKKKTRKNTN